MANTERHGGAAYGRVVAGAWRDPSFKAKLIADAQSTLKQAGVSIPTGVTVKVVENTGTQFHFVLPAKPAGALSDEELDHAAGAGLSGPCGPTQAPLTMVTYRGE